MKLFVLISLFVFSVIAKSAEDQPGLVEIKPSLSVDYQRVEGLTHVTVLVPYLRVGEAEYLIAFPSDPNDRQALTDKICMETEGKYSMGSLIDSKATAKSGAYILVLTQVMPPDTSSVAIMDGTGQILTSRSAYFYLNQQAFESVTCTFNEKVASN